MKRNFFLVSLILLAIYSFAQEKKDNGDEIKTLFNGNNIKQISGFGGPCMLFTKINGKFAHYMGGGGGILLNNAFHFGGFGYGKTTPTTPKINLDNNVENIEMGYGGFWLAYAFFNKKTVHPVLHIQTGWGGITLSDKDHNALYSDGVFIVNPILELEANITHFLKVGVGVNYQYTMGVELKGYSNEDFSSQSVFLSFKFGGFY